MDERKALVVGWIESGEQEKMRSLAQFHKPPDRPGNLQARKSNPQESPTRRISDFATAPAKFHL
ncbi:MAG: hypothetical protein AMXMBFR75_15470 [Candidatus Hinthialibacteria bacterium]